MVSFSYFYIYCITETTLKSLTSILILIQILSIFIITQRFTEKLFDRETSIINQLLLISVPFIFFFVFIGQESGYITLSIISTIYFIYISQENMDGLLLSAELLPF
jgi:Na+/melibiose symporter-like transporter